MKSSGSIISLALSLLVCVLGLSAHQSLASGKPDLYSSVKSFTFHDAEGKPAALGRFAGRPLLINYWATWCAPCVKEMPELDAFSKREAKRGGVQVVGITTDESATVQIFLKRVPVGFPIFIETVADKPGSAVVLGDTVGALPYSVLIDAKGNIVHRKHGPLTRAELDIWLKGIS